MASAKLCGQPDVQLTLTYEEAKTLQMLLMRVGGSPARTRRRHVDAVLNALAVVGLEYDQELAGQALQATEVFFVN